MYHFARMRNSRRKCTASTIIILRINFTPYCTGTVQFSTGTGRLIQYSTVPVDIFECNLKVQMQGCAKDFGCVIFLIFSSLHFCCWPLVLGHAASVDDGNNRRSSSSSSSSGTVVCSTGTSTYHVAESWQRYRYILAYRLEFTNTVLSCRCDTVALSSPYNTVPARNRSICRP